MPRPTVRDRARQRSEEHTHVLLSTQGGQTILPRDAEVWVKVGDGTALKKRAEDVRPDESVLERNTSIDLSLDDIKTALLRKSIDYQAAHGQLYTQTGETKLQAFLHHVLGQKGYSAEDLADETKFREATALIANRLERANRLATRLFGAQHTVRLSRSESTIGDWLTGQTVLPSSPKTLRMLRALDPAEFDKTFGSSRELRPSETEAPTATSQPVLWAHRYWASRHSALRNWISGFAPSHTGSTRFTVPSQSTLKTAGEPTSTATERQIIFDELIQPIHHRITRELAFNMVHSVKTIPKAEARAAERQRRGPTMPKGVVTAEAVSPARHGVHELDVPRLVRESGTLSGIINHLIAQMPTELSAGSSNANGVIIQHCIEYAQEAATGAAFNPNARTVLFGGDAGSKPIACSRREAIEIGRRALAMMSSGELDKINGLPHGTISALQSYAQDLQRARPEPLTNAISNLRISHIRASMTINQLRKPRTIAQQMEREQKVEEIINAAKAEAHPHLPVVRSYGVSPLGMLLPYEGDRTPAEYAQRLADESQLARRLGITHPKPYSPMLSRQETTKLLSRIGLDPETIPAVIEATPLRHTLA